MKVLAEAQVGLAEHQAVIIFVGQDDEVADQCEKYQVPFVIRHPIVKGGQMSVGRIEFGWRRIFYVSYLEIPELIGPDLMKTHLPLAEIFLVILDDRLVIAVVLAVLFPKPFLEFGARK